MDLYECIVNAAGLDENSDKKRQQIIKKFIKSIKKDLIKALDQNRRVVVHTVLHERTDKLPGQPPKFTGEKKISINIGSIFP